MRPLISRLTARVRLLLAPPDRPHDGPPSTTPPAPSPEPFRPAPTVRAWYEPIDGAATALVRPYLRAYEEEEGVRQRRRIVLLAATYGIDLDTRDIHHLEAV